MATKSKVIERKPRAVEAVKTDDRYHYAVGRRKTAVAQIRLHPVPEGKPVEHVVNGKPIADYFPVPGQSVAVSSLQAVGLDGKFRVSVSVHGGGVSAQAEAIRLGIARALLLHDETLRTMLRVHGLLTRDSRSVERKKPGLKKARRAPQWSKR
jgi:small subunit ribosomal protein S9